MESIIEDLKLSSNYFVKTIDHKIMSEFVRDKRNLSIHNKIITITAEQENAQIITKDQEIKNKANVKVIW